MAPKSHAGGRLAHACGPNPLTFPTHGLGRAGIYRLPMAQSAAAPPPPSAASDVESGLETTAPPPSCARAHGCAALLLPDMKLTAAGVPPEGTPALRLLLRYAACRPCTTLVGMSPPMLRACSAACCLRCFAGDFYEMCACTRCARIPLTSAPSPCRTRRRCASQRVAVVCLVGLIRIVRVSPRCRLYRLSSSVEAAHHVLGFCDEQFVHPRRDDR